MIAESDYLPFTLTVTIGAGALVAIVGLIIKYLYDRKKNGGKD